MTHHTVVCRLGVQDTVAVKAKRPGSVLTEISFIDAKKRLNFGLGQALDQLSNLGLRASEDALDLALLAALLTAADTRVSREDTQDRWTREIDLHLPVADVKKWNALEPVLVQTLGFLTGDRWAIYFRPRIVSMKELTPPPRKLLISDATCVCLFSGGLDSFIGATDLLAGGERPLLVSHYWDGTTSVHQTYCAAAFARQFPGRRIDHIRAHVGFASDTIAESSSENTLRGRSFLFFALAALAASAFKGKTVIHVPENGLISLNVPLDRLRLGSLSTRTTHPFYMVRFNEVLAGLGLNCRLENRYRFKTKGQMIDGCAEKAFLGREAKNTMSCSAPTKYRFSKDKSLRKPQHCGHCVPCLIRRASLQHGFGKDDTSYAISDLRARALNTTKAEGVDVRSFQTAVARLKAKPKSARIDIHRPGPLVASASDLAMYEKVYIDGLREVGKLLAGVKAKPL